MTMDIALNTPIWVSFKQKDAAQKIINQRTLYAAGLGFLPFPLLDAIGVTSTQIWMIRDIAKVYDIPFKRHQIKSFIGSIIGNLGAMGILKIVPGLGTLLGGSAVSVSAASTTYALGRVFMQHFDQGGTLLDFNPTKSRAYFQELYSKNRLVVQNLKAKEVKRMTSYKKAVMAIAELKKTNERLREEEQFYEELLKEAEQFIVELQMALREQEIAYLAKENESKLLVINLEKANKNLIAAKALL